MTLLVKEYGLFGTWAGASPDASPSRREPLDRLITKGALKPPDLDILANREPSTRFNLREKRELAVKLGFCLMNFFNTQVTSRRVYFLDSTISGLRKRFPHLAFSQSFSTEASSRQEFRIGHPVFLSFAKLLLEVDYGQTIDLDISPCGDENEAAWLQLLSQVDRLSAERSDSYLEAISNCLLVHRKIAKILISYDLTEESGILKIRKTLYKEVVRKLEDGLAESTSRDSRKRGRSTRSPSPDYLNDDSAEQRVSRRKKRSPLPLPSQHHDVLKLALCETRGCGNDARSNRPAMRRLPSRQDSPEPGATRLRGGSLELTRRTPEESSR